MPSGSLTISELQRTLVRDLIQLFPGNEAVSISRLILEKYGYTPIEIAKDPGAIVQNKIHSEIKKVLDELGSNRPVQYILEEAHFFDLLLEVNEYVLIPRQETEEMVSMILLDNKISNPRIIDLGTGSGSIAIALAVNLPGSDVHAIDIDAKALKVATRNAEKYNCSIQFHQADMLEIKEIDATSSFDIIVSNPPYVTQADRKLMAPIVLEHEPEQALFAPGEDPLLFFRRIAEFARAHLAKGGKVWTEINENLGRETVNIFEKAGFGEIRLLNDIHGKNRFIKAWDNA